MLAFNQDMFVRVREVQGERAPQPRPLSSGFNEHTAYRVLGVYNASESSDAFFILPNDRNELWFICQRHLRFVGLRPGTEYHFPLPGSPAGRCDSAGRHLSRDD